MKLLQPVKRSTAFTLIEFIVVVGIIAVLAGIFMPRPPHRSRPGSKTVQCMNNLKQIGMSMELYSSDHVGLLPWQQFQVPLDTNSARVVSSLNLPAWQYAAQLSKFVRGSNWSGIGREFRCPVDTERITAVDNQGVIGDAGLGYFIALNQTDENCDVIAMGDRNLSPGQGQPLYSSPNAKPVNVNTNTTVWGVTKGNRFHEADGILLFTDGHVEYLNVMPMTLTRAVKAGGTNANRFLFPQ